MDSNDKKSSVKSHEELIEIIDELKEFENIEIDENFNKKQKTNEIIEIDKNEVSDNLIIDDSDKRKDFFKNISIFSNKEKNIDEKSVKEINPSTFKIGFNDNGELVNLDFRIKKQVENKESNKKKNKSDDEKSNKSKFSKIKNKFSNIGKLKKIIPTRNKKEKKPEEGSEQ